MTTPALAYISGPLTSAPDLASARKLYEETARLCKDLGIRAFVPHLRNDPELAPDVLPDTVFARDMEGLRAATVVIAYIGSASTGVGAELAIALASGTPVVAVYAKGEPVSRFILGLLRHHSANEIVLTSYVDALDRIAQVLHSLFGDELETQGKGGR